MAKVFVSAWRIKIKRAMVSCSVKDHLSGGSLSERLEDFVLSDFLVAEVK